MEKTCWSCGNYKSFYTKGFCCFSKANYGFCSKTVQPVEKHGACDHWRMRPHRLRIKKSFVIRSLEETMIGIAAIKEILEEDREEEY